MAFSDSQFAAVRPYVYHLTNTVNLDAIKRERLIHCASSLMRRASDTAFLREKRKTSITLRIGAETIHIRDQQPLHNGNIQFEGGWSFADLIQSLNERIFFWPGSWSGPISYGQRHFERYLGEKPAIIRVRTEELMSLNSGLTPLYCRYNSGSPRCSGGVGSPRGPNTFVDSSKADFTAGKVVELTFPDSVRLPPSCEISASTTGPWRLL